MAGRNVPELETFTFDNGVEVKIRPVSPMLAAEVLKGWRKANPEPQPPMQEVDVLGAKRREPNFDDPEYRLAVSDYQQNAATNVGILTLRMMIKRGVECKVDPDAVKQLREDMAELGAPIDPDYDDKYIYVAMFLASSQDEMNRLRDVIMKRSQPTPEEVNAAKETFRG